MERFEFNTGKISGLPNDNLKNGPTRRGAIEIYPDFPVENNCLSLDIRGPVKAYRGSAILDKATARKVGAALLEWAGFNVDVPLLVSQITWLAGLQPWTEEQEGLLNLLGGLRDLFETV